MTAYNWTIATCEHEVATGGITVAHWRVTAEDGEYTASAYGTVGFSPNPEDTGFVPYAQVTEADVLNWVWAVVNKDDTEANLQTQMDADKNPTTTSGTPW